MKKTTAAFLLCISALSQPASAAALTINDTALSGPDCLKSEHDQRYWSSETATTVAEGSSTVACVLGFPHTDSDALISLNGKRIVLREKSLEFQGPENHEIRTYSSQDGKVTATLRVTESETSCGDEGMEDKCCGGYTYAKLTVRMNGKKATIRVQNYQGG
jgi:hypothetical protein